MLTLVLVKKSLSGGVYIALKAGLGILISLMISTMYTPTEFVFWTLFLSLSVFVTLSDFGIGHLIVAELLKEKNKCSKVSSAYRLPGTLNIINEYTSLYMLLALTFFAVISVACFLIYKDDFSFFWLLICSVGIFISAFRVIYTPILAEVVASGNYHLRKKLEFLAYLGFAIILVVLYFFEFHFLFLVMFFPSCLLLPALYFYFQAKKQGFSLNYRLNRFRNYVLILRKSFPYFIINTCSFLTRFGIPIIIVGRVDNAQAAIISQACIFYFQGGMQLLDLIIKLCLPNYVKFLNVRMLLLFSLGAAVLSSFIWFSAYLLKQYWPSLYFDNEIYVLIGLLLVVEGCIYFKNSMLTMEPSVAIRIAKLMFGRLVILLITFGLTNVMSFFIVAIVSGVIYLLVIQLLKDFRLEVLN